MNDSTYRETQQYMSNVFGKVHIGCVEPESRLNIDRFVNCTGADLDEPASNAEEQMNVDSN